MRIEEHEPVQSTQGHNNIIMYDTHTHTHTHKRQLMTFKKKKKPGLLQHQQVPIHGLATF